MNILKKVVLIQLELCVFYHAIEHPLRHEVGVGTLWVVYQDSLCQYPGFVA